RHLEEVSDDRRRDMAAGRTAAEMPRLVVTDVDADRDVGRIADEPGVLFVVGGAGLAGDRLADRLHHGPGATLHHAPQDRRDLVGGHRIDHLLALVDQARLRLVLPLVGGAAAAFTLVMLVDRAAVTILDAVDEGWNDAFAAVVEHRIGGHHPQHGGFSSAERI